MPPKKEPNHCHDPEILAAAEKLGIKDRSIINRALSLGEAGIYRGTDASESLLEWFREATRRNKENQPKRRLSNRQKREILSRHSSEE